jgi:hypothetical protein
MDYPMPEKSDLKPIKRFSTRRTCFKAGKLNNFHPKGGSFLFVY